MSTIDDLKSKILDVIKADDYSADDLLKILTPISDYTDDQDFINNVKQLVNIITADRDNSGNLTVKDLELLSKDPLAITNLVTTLLLIIGGVPQLKLKYDAGATEEIIFKLLAFIFLIVVPKQSNKQWTLDEKTNIVNIILVIYQFIKSSQVTQQLVDKVVAWFKSKGWCGCCSATDANKAVIEKRLPSLSAELKLHISNIKEKRIMMGQIDRLEMQYKELIINPN